MMDREYKLLLTCAIYMLKQEEGVYMVKDQSLSILLIVQNCEATNRNFVEKCRNLDFFVE